MYILGISCYYHDAAAVLIHNGKILVAIEEERLSRKKHDSAFPHLAINYCLEAAGIGRRDIDYVVFYEKPFRKFHRILLSSMSTFPYSYVSFREAMLSWLSKKLWIKSEILDYFDMDEKKLLFSQHHLSHAASCFYPSPFSDAAVMTVDGVGEWSTASVSIGQGHTLQLLKELSFPQSLGLLYSAYTAFLGFEVNEGEWKVMGLAPYGKPIYKNKIKSMVEQHTDGSISLDLSYFSFHYSNRRSFSDKFTTVFGQPIDPKESHKITQYSADIAASIQSVTEDLLVTIAKVVREETGKKYLCLAGGVALNSVANYRILNESGFDNMYIQPAAGDSGGALGAALYTYHHVLKNTKRTHLTHSYFGQQFSNKEIEKFLKDNAIPHKKLSATTLIQYAADQIAKGKVVGLFQGRFEWGPRALGNRSILADPRNPKMKDIINSKVKFREAFRPFAPSVLLEKASLIFDLPKDYKHHIPLRFMLYVVPVKKSWQKRVPAINHADNTARPQLVDKKDNPFYHSLIRQFYKKTGVPLVLNTSFNLKGEPVVSSPHDAYSTFMRSGIDTLILGNFVCEKKDEEKKVDTRKTK